jgi:hypothetical protein
MRRLELHCSWPGPMAQEAVVMIVLWLVLSSRLVSLQR